MAQPRDPAEASASLAYPWYVVAVLMVIYIFNFVDRQILSLIVDPIKRDLGISDTQMGLLGGLAFAVFYTFCGLPLGRLADSRSRRGLIAAGLVVWSAMTALCGLTRNFTQLLLARMGVGVGEASLSPAAYSLITDYFPRQKLGTAISVYSMGIYLGSAMSFLLGGLVLRYSNDWRMIFFLVGLPGIALALVLFTVKEPPRRHLGPTQRGAPPLGRVAAYMWDIRKVILTHNIGFALISASNYGAALWVPTFFIRFWEMDRSDTGIVLGIIYAVFNTSGIVLAGKFADILATRGRENSKVYAGLLAALIGTPFTAAIILMPDLTWAWVMVAIAGFFNSAPFGVAPAAIQEIMPPNMRAQASAVYLFTVNLIGMGIGPTAVGWITDHIFGDPAAVGWSFLLFAVAAHIGSVILLWISAKNYDNALQRLTRETTVPSPAPQPAPAR